MKRKGFTMNRKERYTNAALKEALITLLEQKDIDKITVTQICQQAEINRATFYLRYNTIDEFYTAVVKEWAEEIMEEHRKQLRTHGQKEILREAIIQSLESIRANKTLVPVMLKINSSFVFEKTLAMMDEGMPANDGLRFYYQFFMEGVKGIMLYWLANDCEEDIGTLADKISSVFHLMFSQSISSHPQTSSYSVTH